MIKSSDIEKKLLNKRHEIVDKIIFSQKKDSSEAIIELEKLTKENIKKVLEEVKKYIDETLQPALHQYIQQNIDVKTLISFHTVLENKKSKESLEVEKNTKNTLLTAEEDKLKEVVENLFYQNENQTGIQHRMKIQREFFNINQDIRVDYPLLNINVLDMKPIDDTDIVPQIYFFQKHSLPIKNSLIIN